MALTPEEMQEIIKDTFQELGARTYIGMRYVPKFSNPLAWDSTLYYEPLTYVTYDGALYISKTYVPTGVSPTNTTYWANPIIGEFPNYQFTYQNVNELRDGRLAVGDVVRTLGYHECGDMGAAWYLIDDNDSDWPLPCIYVSEGVYAKLIQEPVMNPVQFGVAQDDSSSANDFDSAISTMLDLGISVDLLNKSWFSEQLSGSTEYDVTISNGNVTLLGGHWALGSTWPSTITLDGVKFSVYEQYSGSDNLNYALVLSFGNFDIRNCNFDIIEDSYNSCVRIMTCDNVNIRQCVFTGDQNVTALYMDSDDGCLDGLFIRDCGAYDCGNAVAESSAFVINSSKGCIEGTTVDTCFNGIYIRTSPLFIVNNCVITACGASGIVSEGAITVSNCAISYVGTLNEEEFTGDYGYGIEIYLKYNDAPVNITDNLIQSAYLAGIFVKPVSSTPIRGGSIRGNTIDGIFNPGGDQTYAMFLNGGYDVTSAEVLIDVSNNVSKYPIELYGLPVSTDMSLPPAAGTYGTSLMVPNLAPLDIGDLAVSNLTMSYNSSTGIYTFTPIDSSTYGDIILGYTHKEAVAITQQMSLSSGRLTLHVSNSWGGYESQVFNGDIENTTFIMPPSFGPVYYRIPAGATCTIQSIHIGFAKSLWDGSYPVDH